MESAPTEWQQIWVVYEITNIYCHTMQSMEPEQTLLTNTNVNPTDLNEPL